MLSRTSRWFGLAISAAMFLFSAAVYIRIGDWVAVIFALGSLDYGAFFLSTSRSDS